MSIFQILILLFIVAGYILPVVLTANSKKVKGVEKLGWVVVVLVSAWIGFLVFLAVTTLSSNRLQPTEKQ
ncbi:hypothetical protein KUL42_40100 [Alteromonas sp. KUL42]|uniref:hypothetical protein n=1 Tax=Alteromonas sp. KUL42 TaxID=2480797 RepID=UPI001036D652|nr:hypothetical protein [Alteromonas sp. KUL42]TAP31831.1 hypothetical protein EYR97_19390 [Alteromonas sp. KUL42]GEA09249.1 hypothetical protein KUL42_40100 [Alteromonas sp. KUL42]